MQVKRIFGILLGTGALLLIPLTAMQFTDEVVWDLADFVVAGALLIGAGLMYEIATRKAGNIAYRAAVGIAVAAALILAWMNLAVGLIGSEENPANLLYIGVYAVGIVGAVIARLRPKGMARAMVATAIAQALVSLIAMLIWKPPINMGLVAVFVLNGVFVLLFVGSALLFRRAGATESLKV